MTKNSDLGQKPKGRRISIVGSGELNRPPTFIPSIIPNRKSSNDDFEYSHKTGQLKITPEEREVIRRGRSTQSPQIFRQNASYNSSQNATSETIEPSEMPEIFTPNEKSKTSLKTDAAKKYQLPQKKKRKLFRTLFRKIPRPVKAAFLATVSFFLIMLVICSVWVVNSASELNSKIKRIDALSDKPHSSQAAQVTLLVGNDARAPESLETDVMGARADTIILSIHPYDKNKPDALVSIPRDIFVSVPPFVDNKSLFSKKVGVHETITDAKAKLNATYMYGDAPLLVRTVEDMTGLKVDGYVEVGFETLASLADSVGGLWLCYDKNVHDDDSGLDWKSGCHDVNGGDALAFARMRHSDPSEDLGRIERQRQVVQNLSVKMQKEVEKGNLWNLFNAFRLKELALISLQNVSVDQKMDIWQMKDLVQSLHRATDGGISTTFPVVGQDWNKVLGAGLKYDPVQVGQFFNSLIY